MPIGVNHSTADRARGTALRARRLRRARPVRAHRRAARVRPGPQPLAAAALVADGARRARRCRDRRPPVRGRRRGRDRLAPVDRGVRLPHAALARRPELPRAGAQPHHRRGRPAGASTCWPGGTARNFAVAERYDPQRRRWERLPDLRFARGGIASARLPGGRIVVFGGENLEPGGTTIAPVELFDVRRRRWRRLPDMRTPRHGLGGAVARRPRLRDRGRAGARLPLLAGDRVPRRPLTGVPAQGRHPHAALPDRDGVIIVVLHARLLRLRGRRHRSSARRATRRCSSTARSPTSSRTRAATAG